MVRKKTIHEWKTRIHEWRVTAQRIRRLPARVPHHPEFVHSFRRGQFVDGPRGRPSPNKEKRMYETLSADLLYGETRQPRRSPSKNS